MAGFRQQAIDPDLRVILDLLQEKAEVLLDMGEAGLLEEVGGDNTFAAGDTLTFTDASEPLANVLAPDPSASAWRPSAPRARASPPAQ